MASKELWASYTKFEFLRGKPKYSLNGREEEKVQGIYQAETLRRVETTYLCRGSSN